jgi:selenocysteine lyase/cysteine desulfurase
LGASVAFLRETGVDCVTEHERRLVERFIQGARTIPGVTIPGPADIRQRIGVVSFNLRGISPSKVGLLLDQAFGIMSRIGLHCSPAAHRTMGTFPEGTVRFGFSYLNTLEQVDVALRAIERICQEASHG